MRAQDIEVLCKHVHNSIEAAKKVTPEDYGGPHVTGMTGTKTKVMLNNILAGLEDVRYLEIGCHRGSTFIGAMYNNNHVKACAVDNSSQFGQHKQAFLKNCEDFLDNKTTINYYDVDCFSLKPDDFPSKFNVYFYDAEHTVEAQRKALTHYVDMMDDVFIYIVDDYGNLRSPAALGTSQGLVDSGLEVVYERFISKNDIIPDLAGDLGEHGFWGGHYVAVLKKDGDGWAKKGWKNVAGYE